MAERDLTDRINEYSKSPLYQQIYQLLKKKITNGQWQPGDLVPSEAELVEQYQVSRATVRQALDELVSDGLVRRKQGRGTFVLPPKVEQGLVRIISFTEDMQQRGLAPGTQLLSAGLVPATEEQAAHLEISPGEPLACIERLRLADGEALSIEKSYLVHQHCPGILEKDYTAESLRRMLEETYGIRINSARQSIRAINAPPDMARLLGIEDHGAVLFLERISYTEFGMPIEFLQVYHRGDRYTLHGELRG